MLKHGAGCPAATNSLTREQAMSSRRASSRRVAWFPNEFSDVVWIAVEFRLCYKPFARRPARLHHKSFLGANKMTDRSSGSPEPEWAAFLAIDWADKKHSW